MYMIIFIVTREMLFYFVLFYIATFHYKDITRLTTKNSKPPVKFKLATKNATKLKAVKNAGNEDFENKKSR